MKRIGDKTVSRIIFFIGVFAWVGAGLTQETPTPFPTPTPSLTPAPSPSVTPSPSPSPSITPPPSPTPRLRELICSFNLETDPGWTTESDWAFGVPTGQGGCPPPTPVAECSPKAWGYPDPTSGYTGENVYGYNLNGDYPNDMPQTYYLTTASIDCSSSSGTWLKFWRWLNVERSNHDQASIQASTNGEDWTLIWINPGDGGAPITDNSWSQFEYNISALADGEPSLYLRWGMGPTDDEYTCSGWNIDDIEIWGFRPTPTPVPTASATPTPTAEPSPTPTATAVPTATPVPTPSRSPSPIPTLTPVPTSTPTPTPTPSATPTSSPTPTITPTPTATAPPPVVVYSFPLNSNPGWSTESDWAFGVPLGQGGDPSWCYPDPTGGHTGSNVYGYNLKGDYPNNLPRTYYLTTTALNCSNVYDTHLKFWRWLNVETRMHDCVYIEASSDGSDWIQVWKNELYNWVVDSSWVQLNYNLSGVADGESTVYLRWGMGTTDEDVTSSGWNIDDIEIWGIPLGPTPRPTGTLPPSPAPSSSPSATPASTPPGYVFDSGDYDGDGTSDIAVFRPLAGMWSVRNITRSYFGTSDDIPVPGDYDADGVSDIGVFRRSSGLWGIKGVSRIYFGSGADLPAPGDYDGDGYCDPGLFREASGLWAVRAVTRVYFGSIGARPVPGDYDGDGCRDIGIFRESIGLWALRGISRIYSGSPGDIAVPGDYDGDNTWSPALFRPSSGLWALRGVTRYYFGRGGDRPVPADYGGDFTADPAVFRGATGLWGVRGITRVYYGTSGDVPVTR